MQHPRERRHPFGTARIARLGLTNVEVSLAEAYDGDIRALPRELTNAAVLYPSPSARLLDDHPTQLDTLVVVDGTWPQSRKLLRVSPWLGELPRVAFRPPRPAGYRIRRAKRPGYELSTIEAIAYALRLLEPDTVGIGGLVDAFDRVIDHQIELQGNRNTPRIRARPPT